RVERGRCQHVAGPEIELRPVTRAHDHVAVELPVRERALLVRARVVERDPAIGDATQADSAPADLHTPERAVGSAVRRADRMPAERVHVEQTVPYSTGWKPRVSSSG